VARAIAESDIPLVSGVGHETDFTIADFVADQRAATPTAAAQLIAPERQELLQRLQQTARQLARGSLRQFERAMQQLDFLQRRLVHPAQRMQQQAQHLDRLQQRLVAAKAYAMQHRQWSLQSMQQRLRTARPDLVRLETRHTELGRRLKDAMQRTLERHDARLHGLQQHLLHLDPQQVLARGYSMVRDEHGDIVSSSDAVLLGARLNIAFAQGWVGAEVKEKGGKGNN
jgi:exodeoxyribonuclease VII large subunit